MIRIGLSVEPGKRSFYVVEQSQIFLDRNDQAPLAEQTRQRAVRIVEHILTDSSCHRVVIDVLVRVEIVVVASKNAPKVRPAVGLIDAIAGFDQTSTRLAHEPPHRLI